MFMVVSPCVLYNLGFYFLCNVPILQMPHWLQGYSLSSVKLYVSFMVTETGPFFLKRRQHHHTK